MFEHLSELAKLVTSLTIPYLHYCSMDYRDYGTVGHQSKISAQFEINSDIMTSYSLKMADNVIYAYVILINFDWSS